MVWASSEDNLLVTTVISIAKIHSHFCCKNTLFSVLKCILICAQYFCFSDWEFSLAEVFLMASFFSRKVTALAEFCLWSHTIPAWQRLKKKPNLLGKYTLKLEGKAKDMFTEIRFSSGMGKASLRHTKKRKAAFDIWSSFVHKTSNFEKLFHCTTYRAL